MRAVSLARSIQSELQIGLGSERGKRGKTPAFQRLGTESE